jgi:hypothetical protein
MLGFLILFTHAGNMTEKIDGIRKDIMDIREETKRLQASNDEILALLKRDQTRTGE